MRAKKGYRLEKHKSLSIGNWYRRYFRLRTCRNVKKRNNEDER